MITSSTDLIVNPQANGGIQVVVPDHIVDKDIRSEPAQRLTQQHTQPGSVKDRFVNLSYTNNPDISTVEPLWVVFPILAGANHWVTWWTHSTVGKQLFGVPFTSIYCLPTAATSFENFTIANKWPNADFNMASFPMSTHVDEGYSQKIDMYTQQVMYNTSGADAWVAATMRVRLLINSDNHSVTQ